MSFDVAADAYDRFMGRYSSKLSPQLADFAGVEPGQQVLDVGCGSGVLTAELVRRVGAGAVTACDPSEPFVAAVRARHPRVRVDAAAAEALPYTDGTFDCSLAQLVVHFMSDPVAGLRELARVTRGGGVVAACVWDHAEGGNGPLSPFFRARHRVDPSVPPSSRLPAEEPGRLAELFREAGLNELEEATLAARVEHVTFADWWEPYLLGVGPDSKQLQALDPARLEELRELCRRELPEAPFVLEARAWAVRARVPTGR